MKNSVINELQRLKPQLRSKWGVIKLGYFEDYLDKRHTLNCELNILVELEKPLGWEFFAMKEWIQFKLNVPIDICTPKSLKPILKEEILEQTVYL